MNAAWEFGRGYHSDLRDEFAGRGACSADPAIHEIIVAKAEGENPDTTKSPVSQQSMHPTIEGAAQQQRVSKCEPGIGVEMRRSQWRTGMARMFTTLAAVGALAAAAVVTTPSAALAATCYGASCAGKDPHATGCDASTTMSDQRWFGPDTRYQLRYSYTCNTYYGRWITDSDNCCYTYKMTATRQLRTPYGWYNQSSYSVNVGFWGAPVAKNTAMNQNNTEDRHRVCVSSIGCTDWIY